MKTFFLLVVMLALAPLSFVKASELDRDIVNQQRLAVDLPGTLVVRIDGTSGAVAVFHSTKPLPTDLRVEDLKFELSKSTEVFKNELDRDSSASGWYFYWNNFSYYYPSYYYYGYNYFYRPYYSYYYNNYNYYWYRW